MSTEPWRNPPPAPNLDEIRDRVSSRSMAFALLRAWWPALLWALVIFTFSTDSFSSEHTALFFERIFRWLLPSLTAYQFEFIHHLIRKSAHIFEYFVFSLLLYRGVRGSRGIHRGWHRSSAFIAWAIAAGYSVLDEIHQIFVPSRGPSAWDSLLDSTAALAALLLLFFLYRLAARRNSGQVEE